MFYTWTNNQYIKQNKICCQEPIEMTVKKHLQRERVPVFNLLKQNVLVFTEFLSSCFSFWVFKHILGFYVDLL